VSEQDPGFQKPLFHPYHNPQQQQDGAKPPSWQEKYEKEQKPDSAPMFVKPDNQQRMTQRDLKNGDMIFSGEHEGKYRADSWESVHVIQRAMDQQTVESSSSLPTNRKKFQFLIKKIFNVIKN
jgi:hypothetical protein